MNGLGEPSPDPDFETVFSDIKQNRKVLRVILREEEMNK